MFFEFLIITDNSEHIIDQNNCGYHFGHNWPTFNHLSLLKIWLSGEVVVSEKCCWSSNLSLSKTLNLNLLPVELAAPCVAAAFHRCTNVCVNG